MNGPKLWLPFLTEAQRVYGSAVVAGGACRDWAVNKNINPRDIDIFVQADSELDFEMKLSTVDFNPNFGPLRLIGPDDMRYPQGESNVNNIVAVALGHVEFERESRPVNIIAKTYDPTDVNRLFADFDHSLCQFAFDGDVSVRSSEAAQKTLDTKAIEVYNETPRTYERLRNLTSRNKSYASFTFEDKSPPAKSLELTFAKYREMYDRILEMPIGNNQRAVWAQPQGHWVVHDEFLNGWNGIGVAQ